VLGAVKEAERRVLADPSENKEYLGERRAVLCLSDG
jgi:hypothetical protein